MKLVINILKMRLTVSFIWKKRGVEIELQGIIDDLALFKVKFDVFSSEVAIRADQKSKNLSLN